MAKGHPLWRTALVGGTRLYENRGLTITHPARYIEIGNRDPSDTVVYPDVDLACHKNAGGAWVFTHRDGSSY